VSARFVKNPRFEQELQAEPDFKAHMVTTTGLVAEAITEAAPRKTGYFRRRIRARGTTIRFLDVFWHLVEYGSKNNPAYAPIRRGLRAAGLRFDDPRK
jgi:hypothetical protein